MLNGAHTGEAATLLPVNADGIVDLKAVKDVLAGWQDAGVSGLVSVMLANNETGVLQPVEQIGKIAAEAGALFHVDAVQGAGKIEFDVRRFGCQLLSISAHKMHGPKGVGAMYVWRGTPIEPMMVGGNHERRQRAGTENVPGIVGLGKAAELAMESLEDGTIEQLAKLRDRLEAGILGLAGTRVNGGFDGDERVPRTANTTNIRSEERRVGKEC